MVGFEGVMGRDSKEFWIEQLKELRFFSVNLGKFKGENQEISFDDSGTLTWIPIQYYPSKK